MVSNNRSSKENERKIAKKKIRKGLCGRWGLIQRILLNFLRRNHQWQAQALSHRSNKNSKRKCNRKQEQAQVQIRRSNGCRKQQQKQRAWAQISHSSNFVLIH